LTQIATHVRLLGRSWAAPGPLIAWARRVPRPGNRLDGLLPQWQELSRNLRVI
jgi:hypothetical protein